MGTQEHTPLWVYSEDGVEVPIPVDELPFVPQDDGIYVDEITIDMEGLKSKTIRSIGWSLLKVALRMVILGK